ncbi:MAG: hypothetical protein ABIQ02_06035 [Saprospiraceae bacterium]
MNDWMFGYEFYLTGGFDNSIIDNDRAKTYLPEAKENPARFVSSNSGEPLLTGKLSFRKNNIGELGLSWMGGVYNQWKKDGVILDEKRRVDVFDLDFNTTIPHLQTHIITEFAWIFVQQPAQHPERYGTKQLGGFVDIIQPVLKGKILGWENASLNLGVRIEYADWNVGQFKDTNVTIADDVWSIMTAISFRPSSQTVFHLNYRYRKQHDFVTGIPPLVTKGLNLGIASYF